MLKLVLAAVLVLGSAASGSERQWFIDRTDRDFVWDSDSHDDGLLFPLQQFRVSSGEALARRGDVDVGKSQVRLYKAAGLFLNSCISGGHAVQLVNRRITMRNILVPNYVIDRGYATVFRCSEVNCQYFTDPVVYMPRYINNIAHDLNDIYYSTFVMYLQSLEVLPEAKPPILLVHRLTRLDSWVARLAIASVQPAHVIVDDRRQHTCAGALVLGGKDRHMYGWPGFAKERVLKALRRRVALNLTLRKSVEPHIVFFSRANGTSRRVLDSGPFMQVLRAAVRVSHPNTRISVFNTHAPTFAGQALMYYSADVLITVTGANQVNGFLVDDRSLVIELLPCGGRGISWQKFQQRFSAEKGNLLQISHCSSASQDPDCHKDDNSCSNTRNFSFRVLNSTASTIISAVLQYLTKKSTH